MKKRPTNDDSDEFDVDEPEEFIESGSDWDPEEEEAGKKRKGRAKRTPKKPASNKKKKIEKSSLEDEEHEEDDGDEDSDEEGAEIKKANGITAPNVSMRTFTNGSFVVLKSDIQTKENPPLWKIDGKALLQKYIPFEQEGKILYKNTSTYSGWTPSNQDQYAPAPVTYIEHGKKEIIIEFNKNCVAIEENADGVKNECSTTADA